MEINNGVFVNRYAVEQWFSNYCLWPTDESQATCRVGQACYLLQKNTSKIGKKICLKMGPMPEKVKQHFYRDHRVNFTDLFSSSQEKAYYAIEADNTTDFDEILISHNMFTHHWPRELLKAMKKVSGAIVNDTGSLFFFCLESLRDKNGLIHSFETTILKGAYEVGMVKLLG